MPRVGGLEVLSRLAEAREHAPGASVPVMVFTGSQGADTVAACCRLGAAGFVRKPADAAELPGCLERVLAPLHTLVAA